MYTVKENLKNLKCNDWFQYNFNYDVSEMEEETLKGIINMEDSEYIKNMKSKLRDIC